MQPISKRLEALERAAYREIFGNNFSIIVAIAYHLGGATYESELPYAYVKALGYKGLDELVESSACLFSVERKGDRAAHEARIQQARCKRLVKFGYDLRR